MAKENATINRLDLRDWKELMNKGTLHSVSGLSKMLGKEVTVTHFNLRPFSAADGCDLTEGCGLTGGPETPMVGIYLEVFKGASGHIMLLYPPKVAFDLVDMVMGRAPGSTKELGEMEESAIAEIGNVVGSYFLNSIADDTGVRLQPTPPQVMVGMAGAILGSALEDVLGRQYADDIFVIEGSFSSADREVRGILLVLPSTELIDVVKKRTEGDRVRTPEGLVRRPRP